MRDDINGGAKRAVIMRLKDWMRPLVQRPFDDMTLVLCASVMLGYGVVQLAGLKPLPDALVRGVALGVCLLLLIGVNVLEGRWFAGAVDPLRAALGLAVRIVLIEVASALEGFGTANVLYLIVPMKAFLHFPALIAVLFSLSIVGVFIVRLNWAKPDWLTSVTGVYTFLLFVVGVLLASYTSRLITRERRSRLHTEALLTDLESSHRRLAQYARQAAESATLEERNRLARDIHDGLGHYLTAINIQLEKAAVFHSRTPDEALQAIRDARRLSGEALDDVRHSVGALRDAAGGFALEQALDRLVMTARSASLHIDLNVQGDHAGFSALALLTLYRAAQEGLTNVQRHARARCVRLHVTFTTADAQLSLTDDGCGFDVGRVTAAGNGQGSYGLAGVAERLARVNGRLTIDSADSAGTTLTVCIPRSASIHEIETGVPYHV
jgi:signal transduction histidine kinase